MGSPGAALIPTVWDGMKKKKKDKEAKAAEEDTKKSLDDWSVETQKKIEEDLKRIYEK